MKKIVFLAIFIISLIAATYLSFSPEHLAQPKYMAEFFGLPSEANNSFIVLDKMYSQGKNGAFGMGIDNYWLQIVVNPQSLGQAMLDAGGSQTDSVYSISLKRKDIEGTFIVHKYDDKGHLRFSKND